MLNYYGKVGINELESPPREIGNINNVPGMYA